MTASAQLMIYRNLLASVAEEMGAVLQRTAYSPNIKERCDHSCALFDDRGRLLAQAAHIPVHLGSFATAVQATLEETSFEPGDTVVLNDPYRGGTHLPDISLIHPVFLDGARKERKPGQPSFFVANRAHHADVGGHAPGSMAPATEIVQEGLRIPPIKLERSGVLCDEILSLLLANVRTPDEREGDLRAQLAANAIGARRLAELARRKGLAELRRNARALLAYSERLLRKALAGLPDGKSSFEDVMDDDGMGTRNVKIRVSIEIRGDEATFDFTGTAPQVVGCINATQAITTAAVQYALCSAVAPDIPINEGILAPIHIVAPSGTLVNSRFPGATAAGNVETSQRLVDVVLGALSRRLRDRIPAASCGTMSNLTIGGTDPRTGAPFSYYETIAGGAGASPHTAGTHAVQTHMTNTLNTPVEALEIAYPFRVVRCCVRRGSGGKGRHAGGDGMIREIELKARAKLGLLTERRRNAPYGLRGGKPGKKGRNLLKRKGKSRYETLPPKVSLDLQPGDVVRIETPGGGGFGPA